MEGDLGYHSAENLSHIGPLISIGVPVYNGEATLPRALDSILAQTLSNFEVIISDNHSSDGTRSICEAYAQRDARIRYIRQPSNIGPAANFQFVLEQALGKYFLWAACDDVRSSDFLEENVLFLEGNDNYVASTSPNCFEGKLPPNNEAVSFSIVADNGYERFNQFFDNCWKSHGIFYSVIRTKVLRECELIGKTFIAVDWAIDIYLASRGNIHRSKNGLAIFGANGISSRSGSYRAFRNQSIELMLPFYRLSRYALKLSVDFPLRARLHILKKLVELNMGAFLGQSHSSLYQFYCAHFKPKRKLPKLE